MKNNKSLIVGIISCTVVCAFAPVTHAQVSTTIALADELVARTKPGYWIETLVLSLPSTIDPCKFTTSCNKQPLPVELVYFSGERVDDENVLLSWETASEVDNDHFEIERTLNPRLGFETIATARGNGTTKSNVKYQLSDKNSFKTYTYYRLKQVDVDGSYEYSKIIAVKGNAGELVVTAYPNPGQAKNVGFKIAGVRQGTGAEVVVYDVNGKPVYQNRHVEIVPERDVKLDLPNIPVGKYSIRVTVGQRESVTSFVIVP